jgi:hypothetical protein
VFLASFNHRGRDLIGFRRGENRLVPVNEAILKGSAFADNTPKDMMSLIECGPQLLADLNEAASAAALPAGVSAIPLDEVRWHLRCANRARSSGWP